MITRLLILIDDALVHNLIYHFWGHIFELLPVLDLIDRVLVLNRARWIFLGTGPPLFEHQLAGKLWINILKCLHFLMLCLQKRLVSFIR